MNILVAEKTIYIALRVFSIQNSFFRLFPNFLRVCYRKFENSLRRRRSHCITVRSIPCDQLCLQIVNTNINIVGNYLLIFLGLWVDLIRQFFSTIRYRLLMGAFLKKITVFGIADYKFDVSNEQLLQYYILTYITSISRYFPPDDIFVKFVAFCQKN